MFETRVTIMNLLQFFDPYPVSKLSSSAHKCDEGFAIYAELVMVTLVMVTLVMVVMVTLVMVVMVLTDPNQQSLCHQRMMIYFK